MNIFTVSLFGHRRVDDLRILDAKLYPLIKELVKTHPYINFLIGRNGEFDEYAASIIKRIQKETERENSCLTLVLPYTVANIEYYEKYYDDLIIPESLHGAHPKSAITLRNNWMIDNSDVIIFYIEHESGGAYTALKYVNSLNKKTIDLREVL